MSKLDDALGGKNFEKLPDQSRQTNIMGIDRRQLKQTKQEIKEIFLEIMKETRYANRAAEDEQGEFLISYDVLEKKIEEL